MFRSTKQNLLLVKKSQNDAFTSESPNDSSDTRKSLKTQGVSYEVWECPT